MAKNRVIGKAWQEASTVLGGALGVSFFAGPSLEQLAAIMGFVVVYAGAVVLFAQLLGGSDPPEPDVPAWLENTLSALVGAGVGLAMAYSDAIGTGLAMSLAVLAAVIPTAWRQRWRERRVYRSAFDPAPRDVDRDAEAI